MFVAFAFAGPDPLGELMRSFRALVAIVNLLIYK